MTVGFPRRALAAMLLALPLGSWGATHQVTIEGMKFSPAQLTVHKGDKVVWINRDVVPHTATAKGRFDSKRIAAGKKWTWTAGKPGTYDYVCVYHPGMAGQVVVQ